jgi:hypothetical protein
MIRLGRCFCQTCGKEHYGTGRLGMSQQCSCGAWIPKDTLDRVRYYWITQIAISYGLATFFFVLALFFQDLPQNPWERYFSPILQVPAITSFIVSYRTLVLHKLIYAGDDLMFKYYLWGVGLMSIGFVAALMGSVIVN